MAIIVGDIHGNLEKAQAFLAYRPEEEHIALGDYVDSFYEPQTRQIETLQLLLDSATVLLWGNHDLHYLKTPPWYCTGRQWSEAWVKKFVRIVNGNKKRFKAAYTVDGWLCTHAGCPTTLAAGLDDVTKMADKLNRSFSDWLKKPVCFQDPNGRLNIEPDSIFNIGMGRGGGGMGGIFWYDFKRESGLAHVPQIFGHSETKEPVVTDTYVALDTTNNKNTCWVYDTKSGLVAVPLPPRIVPRRLRDLPDRERDLFWEWMYGQTRPFEDGLPDEDQDFFFPHDYDRWRAGLPPED